MKTITTDNGSEFASHQQITKGLYVKGKDDVIVYFVDGTHHGRKDVLKIPTNSFDATYQNIPTLTLFHHRK